MSSLLQTEKVYRSYGYGSIKDSTENPGPISSSLRDQEISNCFSKTIYSLMTCCCLLESFQFSFWGASKTQDPCTDNEARESLVEASSDARYQTLSDEEVFNPKDYRTSPSSEIASGTFGTIYKAERVSDKAVFAAKRIQLREMANFQKITQDEVLSRVKTEASILKKLGQTKSHAIIKYVGECRQGNYYFIFTELGPSTNLDNQLGKYNPDQMKVIAIQLARVLKILERQNVRHRDIKPENVLIDETSLGIKFIDFGFAKVAKPQDKLLTLCGTLDFMSPDVLKRNVLGDKGYDAKAEWWSLGVTLYYLAFDAPPYQIDLENPLDSLLKGSLSFDSSHKNYSDSLASLLRGLLDVNPSQRFEFSQVISHPWFKSPLDSEKS